MLICKKNALRYKKNFIQSRKKPLLSCLDRRERAREKKVGEICGDFSLICSLLIGRFDFGKISIFIPQSNHFIVSSLKIILKRARYRLFSKTVCLQSSLSMT